MTGRVTHAAAAVVDKRAGATVIWHVQTDPDSATGLSGAWIVGEEDHGLLDGAVPVPVGSAALEDLADAIDADVAALRASARAAKEANPALTLPRFDALERPDLSAIAATFRGEEIARDAWSHAVALSEIIEYWHTLESARRLRKYLVDEYGQDVRPLPWVGVESA